MAINPNRNTNYPYLNQSDQDSLEDISDTRGGTTTRQIKKCLDAFIKERMRIQSWRKDYDLSILAEYKENISKAYKIYFECITIRQLPLSNPSRPSIAECKKERDKLITEAEKWYASAKKTGETRSAEMEQDAYDSLNACVKKAEETLGPIFA